MPIDFTCMNHQDKLNPFGAYLLANYYTTSVSRKDLLPKIQQPLYILNSPRDIPLIMHCAKESGIHQYGMIVVAGRRHRTPIAVDNNKCFILESLGSHSSFVGKNSIAQLAISISIYSPDTEIHAAAAPRQIDGVSCGTDSFIAIKEALRSLRTSRDLFDYDSNQATFASQDIIDTEELQDSYFLNKSVQIKLHEHQPHCVAKYTQSDTLLNKNPYRFFQTTSSTLPSETLAEYSKRHHKIVSRESKDITEKEVRMLDRLEKVKLKKLNYQYQMMQ